MTFTLWIGLRLYRVVYTNGLIRLEGKGPLTVTSRKVTKESQIWIDNT